MANALLVEDAEEFQILVKSALQGLCNVTVANSAEQAVNTAKHTNFDIIILDIGLPDRSGYELCTELRGREETQDVPIFMLTGREEISDKVTSFSLGADDYIVKPFNLLEFQARVAARLKKTARQRRLKTLLTHKNLSLNIITRKVKIDAEQGVSKRINLTPHEFKLLQVLMSNPNVVFSRDHLLTKAWGSETFVEDRTVDKHISSLRKKLESCAAYVQTVTSVGYRFSTEEN